MTDQDPPLRILFVCTANICRSPYAEVRARQLVGAASGVVVGSAGTHGWIDQPMDAPMAAELRARGVDPSAFRSKRLTASIAAEADLILTMEKRHRDFVLDEWPAVFRRTFTLRQFTDVAAANPTIELRALIADASRMRKSPDASGDVPDPYGRGVQAAASTARLLDALVATVTVDARRRG